MFNLGMGEITVILLLALIFLGPKKLPELASGLGRIIKDIRKATDNVKNEIQLDEHIRKPFEELRDAVTLPPEELKRRDRLKKDLEDARRRAEADLAALAASTEAAAITDGQTGDDPAAVGGVPVLPPLPTAGSGPTASGAPVPPPPLPGSGPVVTAPVAPAGTIPAGSRSERPLAKGLPLPARVLRPPIAANLPHPPPNPAPKPQTERSGVTQFLSEADLIPPNAPPPMPPRIPGGTGKAPALPGMTGKTAPAPTGGATADAKEPHKETETKTEAKKDGHDVVG